MSSLRRKRLKVAQRITVFALMCLARKHVLIKSVNPPPPPPAGTKLLENG